MQKASVQTERVAATLNAGQSLVLTVGLTGVLAMAASGTTGVAVTAGDLVSPPFSMQAPLLVQQGIITLETCHLHLSYGKTSGI